MKAALLQQLVAAQRDRKAVACVTNLESGSERLVFKADASRDALAEDLERAFRFDQSGLYQGQFVQVHNPPLSLVIVGAVLIAQSIIPMAQMAGYDVTVIDPRGAFATLQRFPDARLYAEWPDEVLPRQRLDERTALLALTHDPKIDDPALLIALASDVFYIGALGSRKTHAARLERLGRAAPAADLSRIHGPVGLSIGARGGVEIAISILAQMTGVLRLGS